MSLSREALQVLRSVEWLEAREAEVKIKARPPGLLINGGETMDRSLYLEVAAVLEQCGATWHKGHKIHVFGVQWDPGMLEDVIATGEAPPKNPLSFFPTPTVIADEIAEWCDRCALGVYLDGELYASRVLEPSAGTGALIDAFLRRLERVEKPCVELVLVEVDPRRARILERKYSNPREGIEIRIVSEDFLLFAKSEAAEGNRYDAILANPPFDRLTWREHLLACSRLLDDHGRMACVVPASYKDHAVRKQDLELLDVLAASQKNAYPQGTFEGTQIATAAIFTDGEWLSSRTWNGESLWVTNTYESIESARKFAASHGFSEMTVECRRFLIDLLATAAIDGNERVLFDDASLESFRETMLEECMEYEKPSRDASPITPDMAVSDSLDKHGCLREWIARLAATTCEPASKLVDLYMQRAPGAFDPSEQAEVYLRVLESHRYIRRGKPDPMLARSAKFFSPMRDGSFSEKLRCFAWQSTDRLAKLSRQHPPPKR
jgi:16S rRNA G966 N2-methylase RsmD